MNDAALTRAHGGDEQAFAALTDPYRRELQLHRYRILGRVQDAEDAIQDTLLAAWRALDTFEERSNVRTWLYRIATNRSLNMLRDSAKRPADGTGAGELTFAPPEPTRYGEALWLEPYPDDLLEGLPAATPGPELATRPARRSRSRFSPRYIGFRHASARRSSYATSSATPPPRSPRCSRPPRRRSTAR